jgi:hypothetical protein
MPLPKEDVDFLKLIYANLKDEALQPGSHLYEPVYSSSGFDDPVLKFYTSIDFDGAESIRLFSGFRGSGKTTELLRLKKYLEDRDYLVVYANALNYVNPSEPLEISELLMAVAGAFGDELDNLLGSTIISESFWQKILNILKSEIKITEVSTSLSAKTPLAEFVGGISTAVDLKFELKSEQGFRKEVKIFLNNKLREIKEKFNAFFEDCKKAIETHFNGGKKIVFIFDQLEQIRGTVQSEINVISSIERIFSSNFDLLKAPYVHMIYTVPPWMKFVLSGNESMTLIPTIHLWENNERRSHCNQAWAVFNSLIERRLGKVGLERIFGEPKHSSQLIDKLISVCGGHYRDLLRMLQQVVLRAVSLDALPIPHNLIDKVITSAKQELLPITQEDAEWLLRISTIRATALENSTPEQVTRLSRFIDNHFVLYFINGDEWYDIHPLIRDEVKKVVFAVNQSTDK